MQLTTEQHATLGQLVLRGLEYGYTVRITATTPPSTPGIIFVLDDIDNAARYFACALDWDNFDQLPHMVAMHFSGEHDCPR